jgi:hypothetical protein
MSANKTRNDHLLNPQRFNPELRFLPDRVKNHEKKGAVKTLKYSRIAFRRRR